MIYSKPELLLPAGNYEKMLAAIRFGADAVYLAGKHFGLRSAADNFTNDELKNALEYAHSLGKRIYITINSTPRQTEYDSLQEYIQSLDGIDPDAFIVASPGVINTIRKYKRDTVIHLSTQAGATSAQDCCFWYEQGVKRVVLARELSLSDIRSIRENTPADLELEAFIHGSMCVSWSGRCLLSKHLTGRDANMGQCTQPCRWNFNLYEIEEEKRKDQRFPIYETNLGTFIMSSKDMCMIEHIPDIASAGISSLKIEGRMKSAYYAAVCANTYRIALDNFYKDPENYVYNPSYLSELETLSHREYCTGYYYDEPSYEANVVTQGGYISEKTYLAKVLSYDQNTKRATFIQRNKVVNRAKAEVITPGKLGAPFVFTDMRDENGELIESAPHPFMKFSALVPFEVSEDDLVRSGE